MGLARIIRSRVCVQGNGWSTHHGIGGGSYDLAWTISIAASLAGVVFILLLESSSRILVPNWEESLPGEGETSPAAS